jgi:hypothetical protein
MVEKKNPKPREGNIMRFTFQSGARCFVGKQTGNGICTWREWSGVEYDCFLTRIAVLQCDGIARTQGSEQSMLVTQLHPVRYHLKAFLTLEELEDHVRGNLWDRDFIAVAAPEWLFYEVEYKQAA